MPLVLSDAELQIVMEAARPLKPRDREAFLIAVADALGKHAELGIGIVARVCRELQRRHFDPPELRGATLIIPGDRSEVADRNLTNALDTRRETKQGFALASG